MLASVRRWSSESSTCVLRWHHVNKTGLNRKNWGAQVSYSLVWLPLATLATTLSNCPMRQANSLRRNAAFHPGWKTLHRSLFPHLPSPVSNGSQQMRTSKLERDRKFSSETKKNTTRQSYDIGSKNKSSSWKFDLQDAFVASAASPCTFLGRLVHSRGS